MDEVEHPDPTGPEPPEDPESVKATDGEPKEKETPSNVTPLPGRTGKSAAETTPEETEEEEDDGQFTFIVEEKGKALKFSDLIKRGTPVEYAYKLSGKAIPNVSGGLIDPYKTSHVLVADCVVDSVKPAYIRKGDGTVEKVTIYVELKPRIVQQAFSEAGQHLLQEAAKNAA
ncbi:MAG TPA: hypothetical protein VF192_01160 [Longimicrobiales bacterium]